MNKRVYYLQMMILVLLSFSVSAQDFPSRNISIVVPYPPGGVVDPVARILAPVLSKELGQSVMIDNRVGAGGAIGAQVVVRAKPDGHTILFHIGVVAAQPTTQKNAGYDIRRDLVPVSLAVIGPYVLSVNLAFPPKNVQELISYSKANPSKVFYGSAGVGTLNHLAGELINAAAGTSMVHVPYKGNGPLITALMSGEIQLGIDTIPGSKALAAGGKLRMIAVTGLERNPSLPHIPTAIESGLPGFSFDFWEAFFLPKGTPEPIVNAWHKAVVKALNDPTVSQQLADLGFKVIASTPQQLNERVNSDIDKYSDLALKANLVFE
ncbi:MAG: Bug family tripartite tricarboxylate transporter substrate binding protein [Burkholderiaceae bacterium]